MRDATPYNWTLSSAEKKSDSDEHGVKLNSEATCSSLNFKHQCSKYGQERIMNLQSISDTFGDCIKLVNLPLTFFLWLSSWWTVQEKARWQTTSYKTWRPFGLTQTKKRRRRVVVILQRTTLSLLLNSKSQKTMTKLYGCFNYESALGLIAI